MRHSIVVYCRSTQGHGGLAVSRLHWWRLQKIQDITSPDQQESPQPRLCCSLCHCVSPLLWRSAAACWGGVRAATLFHLHSAIIIIKSVDRARGQIIQIKTVNTSTLKHGACKSGMRWLVLVYGPLPIGHNQHIFQIHENLVCLFFSHTEDGAKFSEYSPGNKAVCIMPMNVWWHTKWT